MKRLMIPALIPFLLAVAADTHGEGYAGRAGAFLRMGSGASALATGDAGVARALGAEQAHYNPAGLPHAPANDVYLGYHVLSLDRRLAHVGALVQVPEISFWDDPIVELAVVKRADGGHRLIRERDATASRRRETVGVDDYLRPLADAIVRAAHSPELDERPYLVLDGREIDAGALAPLIEKLAETARHEGLDSPAQVIARIEREYRRVQQKPAAVAVSWTHAGTENIEARNSNGVKYDELGYFENRFAFSFGLRVHRMLSAGVSVSVLYALVPELLDDGKALTSTTFSADLWLQLRPFNELDMPVRLNTLAAGVAAYDLAGKNTWNTTGYWEQGSTKTDDYPSRYRAGIAWSPRPIINLAFDVETDLDRFARAKGGLELFVLGAERYNEANRGALAGDATRAVPTKPALILRGGIDDDRPTFGFGIVFHIDGLGLTRVDYAYVVEDVSPEPTQVLTWRFRFAL